MCNSSNINNNASEGKSFQYKTKITGKTPPQRGNEGDADRPARPPVPTLNVEVTVPLKYLNNFWKSLNLPLINCAVELDLSKEWTKECVLLERKNNITGIDFKITSTKLCFPVINF